MTQYLSIAFINNSNTITYDSFYIFVPKSNRKKILKGDMLKMKSSVPILQYPSYGRH